MKIVSDVNDIARRIAEQKDTDLFWYNGPIARGVDLAFMDYIQETRQRSKACLLLTTGGGNPDAAYKIARYFQDNFDSFCILISGLCKSAGTLLAVGADEIAMSPYGELGPLDIQTYKADRLGEMQSGLVTFDSIETLTFSAIRAHGSFFTAITEETGNIISVRTAAETASQLITGLYAPIFSQIDPSEVGEKSRLMRVATFYGRRLNARSNNLKEDGLGKLIDSYPSHSFVIDMVEASEIFERVRALSDDERHLVAALGMAVRHELKETRNEPAFGNLAEIEGREEVENESDGAGSPGPDEKDNRRARRRPDRPPRVDGEAASSPDAADAAPRPD